MCLINIVFLHLLAKEGFPVFLYPVPERPIRANPGLKVLLPFLYLPSYALLRVASLLYLLFCKLELHVLRQENRAQNLA